MKKIKLTQNKYAFVDDGDYDYLNQFKWCAVKTSKRIKSMYAVRCEWDRKTKKRINIPMHRIIMKAPKGLTVDHIDGDGLNNQRSNLRLATPSQNLINRTIPPNNTSGYKGVTWNKRNQNWVSSIQTNRKRKYLGCFKNKKLAYKAYCEAAKKYHKEFANYK